MSIFNSGDSPLIFSKFYLFFYRIQIRSSPIFLIFVPLFFTPSKNLLHSSKSIYEKVTLRRCKILYSNFLYVWRFREINCGENFKIFTTFIHFALCSFLPILPHLFLFPSSVACKLNHPHVVVIVYKGQKMKKKTY